MLRILFGSLGLLFLAGLPRFVTSPWFDDQFVTSQAESGRSIRVELKDRTRLTLDSMTKPFTLSVSSTDDGPRLALTCAVKGITIKDRSAGVIDTTPGPYCPYSEIPVEFRGFGKLALRLRGYTVIADRDYRRNPVHTAIEWAKWHIEPAGSRYYSL